LKEKREQLAYLQSNSSSVNILEILQLEKELSEQEKEYQQTLTD
jgi:hypothetical protein